MIVITPITRIITHSSVPKQTASTMAAAYTPMPVARPRLIRNTAASRLRVPGPKRRSRYSKIEISSSFRNRGISSTMMAIIARGTASSFCSRVSPPPSARATKAGTEIKPTAEVWVAIVEMPTAHHGMLRPPT